MLSLKVGGFNLNIHIDAKDLKVFDSLLNGGVSYLEYGSGGSTLYALDKKIPFIVSVENDLDWKQKVEKEVSSKNLEKQLFEYIFIDMGEISSWGKPLIVNIEKTKEYVEKAWTFFKNKNPSIVLIDGRFRVACFIECLAHLNNTSSTIVFDDYCNRSYYRLFEDIIKPSFIGERLALFQNICLSEEDITLLKRKQETYFGDLR